MSYSEKIPLTPFGRQLLRTVKTKILAEPLYFDMDTWFGRRDLKPDGHDPRGYCGTTACIAGHCMWWAGLGNDSDLKVMGSLLDVANIPQDVRDTLRTYVGAWDEVASVLLTGERGNCTTLWYAGPWPEPFHTDYALADKQNNHRQMARVAAARIDHLLETGY